jgi:soluble lytic murein transglycosylase
VATFAAPTQRAAFNSRPLVQAVRLLAQQGRATEQALFVRALAESLTTDADRQLAVELGQQVRRQDLAVWVARSARNKGSMFYVRQAFPSLPTQVSGNLWSLAHGITRQESSFDPYAQSGVGARGMMQLMPGTAREQAGKMGLGYDPTRLYTDASYNVMLGSAYFQRMLNTWDGNVPLAVASYNAGAGNVRKWVNAYGDPRGNVDVLKWIEAIPFSETKGYVQRVVENSVVYDSMRPAAQQQVVHVSRYLGKSRPG